MHSLHLYAAKAVLKNFIFPTTNLHGGNWNSQIKYTWLCPAHLWSHSLLIDSSEK